MKLASNSLIKKILTTLTGTIKIEPVNLKSRIEKDPELIPKSPFPTRTIDSGSIIKLQDLRIERGYKYSLDYPHNYSLSIRSIITSNIIDSFSCDIRDIEGLSASKSNLNEFKTLDEFAQKRTKDYISEITKDRLNENLAHRGIRILRGFQSDYLAIHEWDPRLFYINCDGSHHLAAARYIAKKLDHSVPINGKLQQYNFDKIELKRLLDDFNVTIISNHDYRLLKEIELFRATYLIAPLNYRSHEVILLPKDELRSTKVFDLLIKNNAFDGNTYLKRFI
ncbi:DUF6685 family protein [Moritella sp. F3]|uniref:DUF6685 family protein n=1 Tax=Moritella sp. F3 TaxID=2718882 RepID=UPI0018E16D90|nr:DUF6685 family protein [Moritella sp. F3]GIC75620.1 hypothetical protein FMO001_03470 [Moritella sp. F1]GIC80765.1 hypothetical protein FMO003_10460 [Moritella sp. F3]